MKTKFFLLMCMSLFLLGGCGGPQQQRDQGVQDIQPGERSIIEPPAQTQPAGSRLEERNI